MSTATRIPHTKLLTGKESYNDFIQRFDVVKEKYYDESFLNPHMVLEAFIPIENLNYRVDALIMSPGLYVDVRKWGKDLVDFVTEGSSVRKGFMAVIWGCKLLVSSYVPSGTIVVLSGTRHKKASLIHLKKEILCGAKEIIKTREKLGTMSAEIDALFNKLVTISSKKEKSK